MLLEAAVPSGLGGFFEPRDGAKVKMGTDRPMHRIEPDRAPSELGPRHKLATLALPGV